MPVAPNEPDQLSARPARRLSVFGTLFRSVGWLGAAPVGWLGVRQIGRTAGFIRELCMLLRSSPRGDARFKIEETGGFDLVATAFSYGISVRELEQRLAQRRRQTAQMAYASLLLATVFLLGWVWHALSIRWTGGRVVAALEFLPFCGLFFLIAFYYALLNFQIRQRRRATWREYFMTEERFWPR
jgi:hypothetical protein